MRLFRKIQLRNDMIKNVEMPAEAEANRLMKSLFATAICASWVLFVAAGCSSAKDGRDLKTLGLEYRSETLSDPRPNHVHILRVDLANKEIQPAVVLSAKPEGDGPADAVLTNPLKLASGPSVLAFINTNPWEGVPESADKEKRGWFEGRPVVIQGLAVSGGHARSPAMPKRASVWFDEQGHVSFGDPSADSTVAEGIGGFGQILKDGSVIVPPGGTLAPRTALGTDRTGTVLWLVVVDGRQAKYSEGMSFFELGSLMRDLGCWNATNMDGGGSSILGLKDADGVLRVMNSPSDRHAGAVRIRPLPMILTIRQADGAKLPASMN
jgi:hypothetical protein